MTPPTPSAARTIAVVLSLLWPALLDAQEAPPSGGSDGGLPVGEVVEGVVSVADSTTRWAAYLPTAYDPARTWPVLVLMDPRGRALAPMERIVAAAERYGYVVLSSYDTASDFLWQDPNERAVAAMLEDAQRSFSVDTRRVYLVGFSGTTRAAFSLAMRLSGNVAGVIGSGGGLPPILYRTGPNPLRNVRGLAFYGFAGEVDYSHDEMVRVRDLLTRHGVPNRLEIFPGPHDWPPADFLARAVEWMELRAMAGGLRPVDAPLVDSLFRARTARADASEAAGRTLDAWRELSDVAQVFSGLVDVGGVRTRAEELRATASVAAGLEREAATKERFFALVDDFDKVMFGIQVGAREPDARRMIADLDLAAIRRTADESADPHEAAAARRLLEHVFVHTSFYQARAYLVQGRPEHALAMLEVAERAFPDRPRVRLVRAQALALAGRDRDALAQVRAALAAGYPVETIRTDPDLASLRVLPGVQELIGPSRVQPERPR